MMGASSHLLGAQTRSAASPDSQVSDCSLWLRLCASGNSPKPCAPFGPCDGHAGSAAANAHSRLRDPELHAHLQQQAQVVADKGREYGSKGWTFLKAGYASVAAHVEHMARDNGYNMDLGELC